MSSLQKNDFPSSALFPQLQAALSDPKFKKTALATKTLFAFTLKNAAGETASWYLDFKTTGTVGAGKAPEGVEKPDVELVVADEDFAKLVEGKANAQKLFMGGKLKIRGDMMRATRAEAVLKGAREVKERAKL